MNARTSVWFVLTPPVLMLDYAGPAEALRMAAQSGAGFELHHCGPHARVATSIGTCIDGLEALPEALPEASLVIVAGMADVPEPGANPAQTRRSTRSPTGFDACRRPTRALPAFARARCCWRVPDVWPTGAARRITR